MKKWFRSKSEQNRLYGNDLTKVFKKPKSKKQKKIRGVNKLNTWDYDYGKNYNNMIDKRISTKDSQCHRKLILVLQKQESTILWYRNIIMYIAFYSCI